MLIHSAVMRHLLRAPRAATRRAAEQCDELAPSIKKMTGHGTAAEGLISSPPVVSFKAIFVCACSPTFRADLPPQR
jgi:hypothetical protein